VPAGPAFDFGLNVAREKKLSISKLKKEERMKYLLGKVISLEIEEFSR